MTDAVRPLVYSWGDGSADGDASLRDLLGGKGANLQEMARMQFPVPPGFTLTTDVWRRYEADGKQLSEEVIAAIDAGVATLERHIGKRLGDAGDPLLLAVRSGAARSMPGMMDTVLNLGLNNRTVEGLAARSDNPVHAWDCYRRFVQMYGDVVLGVETHVDEVPDRVEDLKALVARLKADIRASSGEEFPIGPRQQLIRAVEAVFRSWSNERADTYRRLNGIPHDLGTACNVMAMVFGNRGTDCGTGVAFTRDAATGAPVLYGNFLLNAQGEDVVAGTHDARPLAEMADVLPQSYELLAELAAKLEKHYRDAQDIEFTVEAGRLWLLQTRTAKRTAQAAVQIAVDLCDEGMIDRNAALRLVAPGQLEQYFKPQVDPATPKVALDEQQIAQGVAASYGAATGEVVFTAAAAIKAAAEGRPAVLVRPMTTPDDVGGMAAAEGILTARGGTTSHAAVVARDMGKPCIVGCSDIRIFLDTRTAKAGGVTLRAGDVITIDGSTGRVYQGEIPLVMPEQTPHFERLMEWADDVRRLGVRANADTPEGAKLARRLGAEGIGLCRTEHMFREKDRLDLMREMILSAAGDDEQRRALDRVAPLQRGDFEQILETMAGLPVTIRLLDPPLHEFLPESEADIELYARRLAVSPAEIRERIERMEEENPMLGHRGCRLGITLPAIYDMQVRAISEATATLRGRGVDARPEIMIPLVSTVTELALLRGRTQKIVDAVAEATGQDLSDVLIGTMIELPRAALTADAIAEHADFFSFGTNDLTQTTWGLSRDDTTSLLAAYVEQGLIAQDPFIELDREGVGELVAIAAERGRESKPDIKLGICGEHGGDPSSVQFFHDIDLDYVSCSPYRVPVARLAAATANLPELA